MREKGPCFVCGRDNTEQGQALVKLGQIYLSVHTVCFPVALTACTEANEAINKMVESMNVEKY